MPTQTSEANEDTVAAYAAGVGLQPSKDDTVHHMGHMWLRWKNPYTGDLSHRGYWPVLDDLPANLGDEEIRDYLCTHSVRGLYKVDSDARAIEENRLSHRQHEWFFRERDFYRLIFFLVCYLME